MVDSPLYQSISETESFGEVGVMLHGKAIFPPATPVNVPIISETRKKENRDYELRSILSFAKLNHESAIVSLECNASAVCRIRADF